MPPRSSLAPRARICASLSSMRATASTRANWSLAPPRAGRLAGLVRARSRAPRSTRSIPRPASPAAPRPPSPGALCPRAGARCASSSGRSATGSARRSSRTSARACCRRRRSTIRRSSSRARAVARFEDGPARRLVHRLKYSDRGELARPMGAWMARAGADVLADADAIAPMPLHRARLWTRRFNQAAALAREVARRSGKPFEPELLRARQGDPQPGRPHAASSAPRTCRARFARAPGAPVKGRRIVLVDDVLTSGATANAAARALLRAGARRRSTCWCSRGL